MSTRHTWQKIVEADSLAFLLLAAFLLRLVVLPLFYDDYNYWAFGVFTNFLLHGQNPYHIVAQDPTLLSINIWRYPPLYLVFTAPALLARQLTGQTLVYLAALKIPFAVADIISTFYLFKILVRFLPQNTSIKFAAFFALNPVVIFESSGGGFNDPIPIALTVAAFYYFLKAKDSGGGGRDLSKSALLLGLGISAKIYPLLLLPIMAGEIRGNRGKIFYLLLSLLPAIATSLPFFLWDWRSYLDLLTVRNVGGQHPLFPGLEFSGVIAITVAVILVASIVFIYGWKLPFISRIVLLFLWVNLAVFAQSFNYMIWGVPFFTLFVAEYRKWFWMPISPIITMIVALVFQGSFNAVAGSTGIFYWTFHLFQLQITPFKGSSFYNPFVFWGLLVSEAAAGYYFLSIARFKPSGSPNSIHGPKLLRGILHGLKPRGLLFPIVLCFLIILSCSTVAQYAKFLPHQYPVVEGTSFQFKDNFHAGLLDYQWVFDGNGTYSLNPSQGTLSIVDVPNGTAYVFRGWAGVGEGFHTSTSTDLSFRFKFDSFLPGSTAMTLANMTDGQLLVQGENPARFLYDDQLNNATIVLANADNVWHDFAIQYSLGNRTILVDGMKWTLPGGSLARFMLGNTDSRRSFGGSAEFSSVDIQVNDFPTGFQSHFAATLALVAPSLFIALLLASLSQRMRRALGSLNKWTTNPRLSN